MGPNPKDKRFKIYDKLRTEYGSKRSNEEWESTITTAIGRRQLYDFMVNVDPNLANRGFQAFSDNLYADLFPEKKKEVGSSASQQPSTATPETAKGEDYGSIVDESLLPKGDSFRPADYLAQQAEFDRQIREQKKAAVMSIPDEQFADPVNAALIFFDNSGRDKTRPRIQQEIEAGDFTNRDAGQFSTRALSEMNDVLQDELNVIRAALGPQAKDFDMIKEQLFPLRTTLLAAQENPSPENVAAAQDILQDPEYQQLEESFAQYMEIPGIQQYQELLGKQSAIFSGFDVTKTAYADYWKEVEERELRQAKVDAIAGTGAMPASWNNIVKPMLREGVSYGKSLLTFPAVVWQAVEKDPNYNWADQWTEAINRVIDEDKFLPMPSNTGRRFSEKVAKVDGYEVPVDDTGKPRGVVYNQEGFQVKGASAQTIIDKYESDREGYEIASKWNTESLLPTASSALAQILITSRLGGAGAPKLGKLGVGANTAQNMSAAGVMTARFSNQAYQDALSELGPGYENIAARFAVGSSIAISAVNMLNPIEAKALPMNLRPETLRGAAIRKMVSDLEKGLSQKQALNSALKSIAKGTLEVQRMGVQWAKNVALEGVEGIGEQLVDIGARQITNTVTDPYTSLDIDASREAFINAFTEEALGGLFAGPAGYKSRNRIHGEALYHAYNNREKILPKLADDARAYYENVFGAFDVLSDGKKLNEEQKLAYLSGLEKMAAIDNLSKNRAAEVIKEELEAEKAKIKDDLKKTEQEPTVQPGPSLRDLEAERIRRQDPKVGDRFESEGGQEFEITEVGENGYTIKYDDGGEHVIPKEDWGTVTQSYVDNLIAKYHPGANESEISLERRLAMDVPVKPSTTLELDAELKNVESALSQINPNVKIVLHEDQAGLEAAVRATGQEPPKATISGVRLGNEIHLNKGAMQKSTSFHEAGHVVLAEVAKSKRDIVTDFYAQLQEMPEFEALKEFEERYSPDQRAEEAVTEFLARVASGEIQLSDTLADKIKAFIDRLLNAINIKESIDKTDLKRFAKDFSRAMRSGKPLVVSDSAMMLDGLTEQETSVFDEFLQEYLDENGNLREAELIADFAHGFEPKILNLPESIYNKLGDYVQEKSNPGSKEKGARANDAGRGKAKTKWQQTKREWGFLPDWGITDDIADIFVNGGRIKTSSFKEWGDQVWVKEDPALRLKYLSDRGEPLDQMAMTLADKWGQDERDVIEAIVEFVRDNPRGPNDHVKSRVEDAAQYQIMGEYGATSDPIKVNALLTAKEMEADGVAPNKIYTKTGWERGKDGKWRYDDPTTDGKFKAGFSSMKPGDQAKLPDIWDAPKLYEAYPSLADISVEMVPFKIGAEVALGTYDSETNTITISSPSGLIEKGVHGIVGLFSGGGIKQTMVHEIQHAIQKIEGFATGAAPSKLGNIFGGDPMSAYINTSGEVEARNAARRSKLPPSARKNTPISVTEDAPRSRQTSIFERDGGREEAMDTEGRMVWYSTPDDVAQYQIVTPEYIKARGVVNDFVNNPQVSHAHLAQRVSQTFNLPLADVQTMIEAAVSLNPKPLPGAISKAASVLSNLPGVSKIIDFKQRYFNASKGQPIEIFEGKEYMDGSIMDHVARSRGVMNYANEVINKHGADREVVKSALEGNASAKASLPIEVQSVVDEMRHAIDEMSQALIDYGYVHGKRRETVKENIGKYVSRAYMVHYDNEYTPEAWAYDEAVRYFKKRLYPRMKNLIPSANLASVLEEKARGEVDKIIAEHEGQKTAKKMSTASRDVGIYRQRRVETPQSIRDVIDKNYLNQTVTDADKRQMMRDFMDVRAAEMNNDPKRRAKISEFMAKHPDFMRQLGELEAGSLTPKQIAALPTHVKAVHEISRGDYHRLADFSFLDKEIKEVMGEIKDPVASFGVTMLRLSKEVETARYLFKMREMGIGKFLFTAGDPLAPREAKQIVAGQGSETLAPLNGLYATPEVRDAMLEAIDNVRTYPVEYKFFTKAQAFINYCKTIASPATHSKNVLGNVLFMTQNGYLFRPVDYAKYGWNSIDAARIANGLVSSKREYGRPVLKPRTAAIQSDIDLLRKNGVLGQNISAQAIKEVFGSKDMEKAILGLNPSPKANPFKILEDAYQAEDDMFKYVSYQMEKDRYAKALFDKEFKDLNETERSEVETVAMGITKDTLPNYGRLGDVMKFISRSVVTGNFIAFQAEALRTQYNNYAIAFNEMRSPNPKVRAIGQTRLAGLMTANILRAGMVAAFGWAAKTGLMGVLGAFNDDEDEYEKQKAIRYYSREWQQMDDLLVIKADNGEVELISMSSADPMSNLQRSMNAYLYADDPVEGVVDATKQLFGSFIEPTILVDVITQLRSNQDAYGKPIYNQTDGNLERGKDMWNFVMRVAGPGAVNQIERLQKAYGEDNLATELAGQLVGMKPYYFDVAKEFERKVRKFAEYKAGDNYFVWYDLQGAQSPYSNLTDEEFESLVEETVAKDRKYLDNVAMGFRYANVLGVPENDLFKIAREAGLNISQANYVSGRSDYRRPNSKINRIRSKREKAQSDKMGK